MPTFVNKHILIVDDDENVLKTLARYLKKKGYRISTASGGREALEKIAKEPPHLVLLDVLMISALKEEVVAQEAIKMGAYEWLPKPFSMEHLETTIFVGLLRKVGNEPSYP